jgi:hypothetical protein
MLLGVFCLILSFVLQAQGDDIVTGSTSTGIAALIPVASGPAAADIEMMIVGKPQTVPVGSSSEIKFQVLNNGPDTAFDVVINDVVPAD